MIDEGKDKKKQGSSSTVTPMVVEICPMFEETFARHIADDQSLRKKLGDFVAFKNADPIGRFGSKDISDTGDIFDSEVPGIRHAAITNNLRIWYTMSGSAPRRLRLYAVMSHDESGTGQPIKKPVIKSVSKRMSSQTPLFKTFSDR